MPPTPRKSPLRLFCVEAHVELPERKRQRQSVTVEITRKPKRLRALSAGPKKVVVELSPVPNTPRQVAAVPSIPAPPSHPQSSVREKSNAVTESPRLPRTSRKVKVPSGAVPEVTANRRTRTKRKHVHLEQETCDSDDEYSLAFAEYERRGAELRRWQATLEALDQRLDVKEGELKTKEQKVEALAVELRSRQQDVEVRELKAQIKEDDLDEREIAFVTKEDPVRPEIARAEKILETLEKEFSCAL